MGKKDNYGVLDSTGDTKVGGIDGMIVNKEQKKQKNKKTKK